MANKIDPPMSAEIYRGASRIEPLSALKLFPGASLPQKTIRAKSAISECRLIAV